MTWTAPAIGTPTVYTLSITRLYGDGGNLTQKELIATIHTPHTSVQLPPDVVVAGEIYYIKLVTTDRPISRAANPLPNTTATAFTAMFTP